MPRNPDVLDYLRRFESRAQRLRSFLELGSRDHALDEIALLVRSLEEIAEEMDKERLLQ